MPTNHNDHERPITRRTALKVGAASGLAAVAGCTTDNGRTEDRELVTERADRRFTKSLHRGTYGMDNASWNPYDPSDSIENFDPPGLIYDPLIMYHQSHETFQGVIADNWEDEGSSILIELSDEWTWHNGDPVTTSDLETDHDIEFAISEITSPDSPPSSYIAEYEVVDDYAMRYHLHDDFTLESVLANEFGDVMVAVKEDIGSPTFGEWRDDLVDVDPESDEAVELVSEFQEWSPEIDDVLGNGPFQLREVTDSAFVAEVYDDHPNADNIYFSEFAIEHHDDQVLAFIEEAVDGIPVNLPEPPDTMDQIPAHHEINRDYDHLWSVLFNFGNYNFPNSPAENPSHQPITSDRRVRQAIACAIDHEQLLAAIPSEYEPYNLPPTFVNETAVEEGLVDIDGYDDYAVDHDRATSLMEEAGFQRDDGQWYDEDGDAAELIMYAGSNAPVQVDALDAIQYQMNEFGFDATLEVMDVATYGEARFSGDHDLLFDNTAIFSLRGTAWVNGTWEWFSQLNHADFEDGTWEIPAEIGNLDAQETTEFNVIEGVEQYHLTGESEDLQWLTWWFNQVLPMYGCAIGGDYGAINSNDWHVDGPEALLDNRTAEFYLTKVPEGELIPYED